MESWRKVEEGGLKVSAGFMIRECSKIGAWLKARKRGAQVRANEENIQCSNEWRTRVIHIRKR